MPRRRATGRILFAGFLLLAAWLAAVALLLRPPWAVTALLALALAGAARAAWRGYVHFDAVCSRTDQA